MYSARNSADVGVDTVQRLASIGDLDGLEEVLRRSRDRLGLVNAYGANGLTPLHAAVAAVDTPVVDDVIGLLRHCHADVSARSRATGDTAVHLVMRVGRLANAEVVVPLLLKAGANASALNDARETPLDVATQNKYYALQQLLHDAINQKLDLDALDPYEWKKDYPSEKPEDIEALLNAITNGDCPTVKDCIIRRNIRPSYVTPKGASLINIAIMYCDKDKLKMIDQLLRLRVSPDFINSDKNCSLTLAIKTLPATKLLTDLTTLMIKYNVNANIVDADGRKPYDIAFFKSKTGQPTDNDRSGSQVSGTGKQSISRTSNQALEKVADLLKPVTNLPPPPPVPKKPSNPNAFTGNYHPVHLICLDHKLSTLEATRQLAVHFGDGTDLNIKSRNEGDTCLHICCQRQKLELAQFLVGRNADIIAKNKKGDTPIVITRGTGNRRLERLLLDANREQLQRKRESYRRK